MPRSRVSHRALQRDESHSNKRLQKSLFCVLLRDYRSHCPPPPHMATELGYVQCNICVGTICTLPQFVAWFLLFVRRVETTINPSFSVDKRLSSATVAFNSSIDCTNHSCMSRRTLFRGACFVGFPRARITFYIFYGFVLAPPPSRSGSPPVVSTRGVPSELKAC